MALSKTLLVLAVASAALLLVSSVVSARDLVDTSQPRGVLPGHGSGGHGPRYEQGHDHDDGHGKGHGGHDHDDGHGKGDRDGHDHDDGHDRGDGHGNDQGGHDHDDEHGKGRGGEHGKAYAESKN